LKTFTNNVYLGIESLYKPSGFSSFELISYIMDSNLDNVRKVMRDENIDTNKHFACGDVKEIFSRKVHR